MSANNTEQDRQDRTGHPEKDRTARKGQPEWDRQNKTSMTGLLGHEPGQNCQDRAARTGLPG